MRTTVSILGLLAALSAAGCARESTVSTAPVPSVQEAEPSPQSSAAWRRFRPPTT
jgi:hypothetical protein